MKLIKLILIVGIIIAVGIGCEKVKQEESQTATPTVSQEKATSEKQLIKGNAAKSVTETFADLKEPVELVYFTQEVECQFCTDTRQLLTELAQFSEKVELKVYDFVQDKNLADDLGVDKIPATVVRAKSGLDKGIKFYGIPAGYEFPTLLEGIHLVSTGEHGFSDEVLAEINSITEPVHIQVFITPT